MARIVSSNEIFQEGGRSRTLRPAGKILVAKEMSGVLDTCRNVPISAARRPRRWALGSRDIDRERLIASHLSCSGSANQSCENEASEIPEISLDAAMQLHVTGGRKN